MKTDLTDSIAPDRPASTIREFCARWKIGPTKYYKMRNDGRGPRELRVGGSIRITAQAEADWVREHETPTGAEARLIKREREAHSRRSHQAGKTAAASPRHVSKAGRRSAGERRTEPRP